MAEGLMESGAEVAIIGTSDKVYSVAEEFQKKGYRCHGVKADLSDRDQCQKGFDTCMELLGDLDILVAAHGIQRQQRYEELTQRIPAHRWGTGEDMKGTCIFLASHASDYLGGAIIPVDGGYLVM